MKRALATFASIATLLSFSPSAFARTVGDYSTRNHQPRLDQRALKSATLASYRGRHNRAYSRARYNGLVQRMMPSLLAVTGPNEPTTDHLMVNRPGTRMIDNWTFASSEFGGSKCTKDSRRCGEDNH